MTICSIVIISRSKPYEGRGIFSKLIAVKYCVTIGWTKISRDFKKLKQESTAPIGSTGYLSIGQTPRRSAVQGRVDRQLRQLPEAFGRVQGLRVLDVSRNQLEEMN
jgi:hypothetical protein